MKNYDILIIGGGIVGTAIARELSKYRLKIALLEKEEELAFGVSKANSGIIHPGTQNKPDSLKGKLCVQGNMMVREISGELGVDFKEVGELIVALSNKEVEKLHVLKNEAEQLGVPGLELVSKKWLKENEPNLTDRAVAALYAPTAGIISPYRFAYDLCENAKKNGVKIFTSTEVKHIEYKEQDSMFKIFSDYSEFEAKYIINAAGLFGDEIANMVGINDFKITPRKGEEFLLDKKKENLTEHLIFPIPTKVSKGILIIKTADGNPMVGPTAKEVDDKYDLSTTDEGYLEVMQAAKTMVPSINENDIIAYFAGLRPACGDDFIIRHEDKVPGFVNVTGIQSPGLTAAPAIAVMVVEILKNNGLTLKKKVFFHRKRKKTKHLFAVSLKEAKKIIRKNKDYGEIVCRCEMVSKGEIIDAIKRGARTLDGVKFRTRAQAGRCHGSFCTAKILKILSEELGKPVTEITKRGKGSYIIAKDRNNDQ